MRRSIRYFFFSCLILLLMLVNASWVLSQQINEIPATDYLSPSAISVDGDKRLNDNAGNSAQNRPRFAMNKYGCMIACWEDNRAGNSDIYVQIINNKGIFVKQNFKVNDDVGTADQYNPDVAIDPFGHFMIVWEDERGIHKDIYAQLFEANGNPIGQNIRVNDDVSRTLQQEPAIAVDDSGNYVICWIDKRNGSNFFLYAQLFNREGSKVGENFEVKATPGTFLQTMPAVAKNASTGDFIIVWVEAITAEVYDVYGQRFDMKANPVEKSFEVSKHPDQNEWAFDPVVAMWDDGKFGIFWSYARKGGQHNIYGQTYDAKGRTTGEMMVVNDASHDNVNRYPSVCVMLKDRYLVAWNQYLSSRWQVYFQLVRSSGIKEGSNSHLETTSNQKFPAVGMDHRMNMITVFEDDREGNADIYANWNGPKIPLNLTVGSGFNGIVPITWEPIFGAEEVINYDIYRSTDPNTSFEKIATADILSRGAFKALMLDWIDTPVKNGQSYYYKIGAPDEGPTAISLVQRAIPATEGHKIQSSWAQNAPKIDGKIEASEWSQAFVMNFANPNAPRPIRLYVQNNRTRLFLAVKDPNDWILNAQNLLGIIFDEDNNDKWDKAGPSREGLIAITNTSTKFTGYWGEYPNKLGADSPISFKGIEKAFAVHDDQIHYEVAIDLDNSPLNVKPGQTIGAAIWVDDPGTFYAYHYGNAAKWPAGALWEEARSLGDLTLATETTPPPPDTSKTYDWPMAHQCKQQTSWAWEEKVLYPPFNYRYSFETGYGLPEHLSYSMETLFASVNLFDNQPNTLMTFTGYPDPLMWSFPVSTTSGRFRKTPTVNNSLVFISSAQGTRLYALNRSDGSEQWSRDFAIKKYGSPIIDNNQLFFMADSVYCLNPVSGKTIWSKYFAFIGNTMAVDNQSIYLRNSTDLFAIDKSNGAVKWNILNHAEWTMVDEQFVYTFTHNKIIALNKSNAQQQWEYAVSPSIFISQTSLVAAMTDSFLCFVVDENVEKKGEIYTLNKKDGTYRWHFTFPSIGTFPPTIANGVVYVLNGLSYHEDGIPNTLWGFDIRTGTQVFFDDKDNYWSQPIVAKHTLYIGVRERVMAFRNTPMAVESSESLIMPSTYTLYPNFPNPFNPGTRIRFYLPGDSPVRLELFNIQGQRVQEIINQSYPAGLHEIDIKAENLTTGVYFCRIEMGTVVRYQKIMLLK
ncbi:PQQ-binding-like beta-propeller repeat protein [candidate division KSB1 bacterium]|nr:PQQ-binding-like beta-propeller repeat protein [candidate division KSB1 bacterium]